ncbi:MAG TPA: hypothetical protein VKZ18_28300 [Polyangia bacterium]|nr:hypothetical protein [Polyangia bacterium]
MKRLATIATAALAAMLGGPACQQDAATIVVVNVAADADVPPISQLRVTVSNAGVGEVKLYPQRAGAAPIGLPTAFSLSLPTSRAGELDIALDGLDAGGAAVASGAGSVTLVAGATATLSLTLSAGASLCGNGRLDPGEQCDDGNRVSDATCSFVCLLPAGTGGTGGQGGQGGRGGQGGQGDTGGATGTGGGGAGGAGHCTTELLSDGNFDSLANPWTSVTSGRALIYNQGSVDPQVAPQAQSAPNFAWLGYNVYSETVILSQPIVIPESALSLTLSGYVEITTDEGGGPSDFGYVELLLDGATTPLESWSNVDAPASSDWTFFTATVPVGTAAGAAGTFQLRVVMDDGTNTSFFFDTLSLAASSCPNP